MAPLRFTALAFASLLLLQGAYGDGPQPSQDQAGSIKVVKANCLTEMNQARAAVSYDPFTETAESARKLPTELKANAADKDTKFWTSFCKGIQGEEVTQSDKKDIGTLDGTVAYAVQAEQNCGAAVEQWKGGFASFGTELPPKYQEAEEGKGAKPYDTDLAVSFVALYNPEEQANAECVFVKCPAKPDGTAPTGPTVRRLEAVNAASALVCLSHPNALKKGKLPYKEEQWKKITDVFAPSSSAFATAPSFLALAAAAVGLAFF